MRTPSGRWLLPLLVLAVVAGCERESSTSDKADVAAIEAKVDSLSKAYMAAVAARDTDAVANQYADDARFLPANSPRADGKPAIRQQVVGLLSMPGLEMTGASTQRLVSEDGDMVVDVGTYHIKWAGPKGKPIEDSGKTVTVLKKVNGEWKIVVDTFNSDTPMPGMGK
jgi:uncharacterized protein (TIGR02246 family)